MTRSTQLSYKFKSLSDVSIFPLKTFVLLGAMVLISVTNISSQVGNGSADLVSKNSENRADRNHKSISRVNPSTLAMEMSLPLITYPGRGGNGLPVGLNYSSKAWRMETGLEWWYWLNTQPKYVTDISARYAERSAAGWTSTLLPPRIEYDTKLYTQFGQEWRQNIVDEPGLNTTWQNALDGFADNLAMPCGTQCNMYNCELWSTSSGNIWICTCTSHITNWCDIGGGGPGPTLPVAPPPTPLYYVKRLNVVMPDGSGHEFRASDEPLSCGTNVNVCTPDYNGTYLSVDGSGIRLVKSPTGHALFMPDGNRYLFPSTAQRPGEGIYAETFIDRNGNTSVFSSITNQNTGIVSNKWTDSVGREIVDPTPHNWTTQTQNAGITEKELPGLSVNPQSYEFTWANLKPLGCETNTSSSCVGTNGAVGGALEDQEEKLFYETKYFCRGSQSDDLLTQSNGEVLFPNQETGIRPCNSFELQRDANRNLVIESNNPVPSAVRFNPVVLSAVKLPNGSTYEFSYNRYGEISRISYPSGGYETFEYSQIAPLNGTGSPAYDQTNRGVTARKVYESDGNLLEKWTYAVDYVWESGGNSSYKITTRGPKTNDPLANTILSERSLLSFYSGGGEFGFENPLAGTPKEERTYDENGALRTRTINESITKDATVSGIAVGRDPRFKRSVSMMFEPGSNSALATLSETDYDDAGSSDLEYFSHLNAKRKKSYHYAVIPDKTTVDDEALSWTTMESWFPQSNLASVSETDYSYDPNYKARGIIGLPTETRVMNPAFPNDPTLALSKTQTVYDNQLPGTSGTYPGSYFVENYGIGNELNCGDAQNPKICWQSPQSNRIGRPTTSRVWNAETQSWIETHTRYDIFGNAIAARDPIGNEATTEFSADYKYAYPTKVISPAPDPTNTTGTNQTSTAEMTYDFTTGLPLTVKDDFGQITRTEYDASLRPVRGFAENFTAPETQTIYGVPDANGQLPANQRFVKVRKQIDATNWDEAVTWFDGLGRTIKTQAKDSQGDVFVETHYDSLGRVDRVTNPYRAGDTVYWSKTRYDEAGRAVETYAPATLADITTAATNNNANLTSLGVTSFDISTVSGFVGTVVTTTDASGRKGRSITNALGQLVRVDEPTGISASADADLGTLANPAQKTTYEYDAYGKMVHVQQEAQHRYFKYDSLGHLLRVRQPEQEFNASLATTDAAPANNDWTAGFVYDIIGNVVRATDANGVNIINEYDKASRVTKRCYTKPNVTLASSVDLCDEIPTGDRSTDTSTVENFYDGKGLDTTQTFAKGKLTKVKNDVSQTRYTVFDNFGRLKEMEQTTPVGDEIFTNATARTSKYTYNFSGALIEEEYPSGRKVKNEFESDGDLLRVTSKKAGSQVYTPYVSNFSYTASGGISQMRLGNGKWETAKFNSRLQVYELGLGNSATNASLWKVNYDYGELHDNGTVDATKNTGNIGRQTLTIPGASFVQNYKYDSLYRLTEAVEPSGGATPNWSQTFGYDSYGNRTSFSQTKGGVTTNTTPAVDPDKNRFTSTDFGYDNNGNIVSDLAPVTSQTRLFTFNGDNKQTEVIQNGVSIGRYFYDGEGKRVKKIVGDETTVFVYSSGKLVAEYATTVPAEGHINYTTTDHLGTPRIITDELDPYCRPPYILIDIWR